MKTKKLCVLPHVRTRNAKHYQREASGTEATKLLNQIIRAASQELKLQTKIIVSGSVRKDVPKKVTFNSEALSFSIDFGRGGLR